MNIDIKKATNIGWVTAWDVDTENQESTEYFIHYALMEVLEDNTELDEVEINSLLNELLESKDWTKALSYFKKYGYRVELDLEAA
tara:strand:- start:126 stop:380 length:255 start_codon:yes stop_codon:yes gene_type:complete